MKKLNLISLFILGFVLSVSCSKDTESTPAPSTPPKKEQPKQDEVTPQSPTPQYLPSDSSISGTHIPQPINTHVPSAPHPRISIPSITIPPLSNDHLANITIGQGVDGLQVIRTGPRSSPSEADEDNDQIDQGQRDQSLDDFFNPKPGYQIKSPEFKSVYVKLNELSQKEDRESILINDDIRILSEIEALKSYAYGLSFSPYLLTDEAKFIVSELKRIEASLGKPLEHLRRIEKASNDLKTIGFELELFENEYRWREREVIDESGSQVSWSFLLLKENNIYIQISSVQHMIKIVPLIRKLSDSVGDYGKAFKSEMTDNVLSRWRTVIPLLKVTEFEIREFLKG